VKHCNIPPRYQEAVIRSALVLKLHCFEDTGAIVAATTTSIPEAPAARATGTTATAGCATRTTCWRHCVFSGTSRSASASCSSCSTSPAASELALRPLYRVDGSADLEEHALEGWAGFEGHAPVRIGNQAVEHVQNDVFGELVLALAPVFLDQRFHAEQTPAVLDLLVRLARKGIALAGTPDAGIWEYRTVSRPQTFSTLMGWAAADRMRQVAARHAPTLVPEFSAAAERLHAEIVERAWNPELGAFVGSYGSQDLDAAVLQMAILRFLPRGDPRLLGTIDGIARGLDQDGWLQRYRIDDGFGRPEVAFALCTLWYIEALGVVGRAKEAETVLERVLGTLTPLGLLSEDFDPRKKRLWGNFPQAYSHVGLIHAAFATSPRWSEVT
jgi:GH15 family glucan-1,4-alpha-glucosidase